MVQELGKTYNVLCEISKSPISRSALKKKFGDVKEILDWAEYNYYTDRQSNKLYTITELGEVWLDNVDEDRIRKGVYTG